MSQIRNQRIFRRVSIASLPRYTDRTAGFQARKPSTFEPSTKLEISDTAGRLLFGLRPAWRRRLPGRSLWAKTGPACGLWRRLAASLETRNQEGARIRIRPALVSALTRLIRPIRPIPSYPVLSSFPELPPVQIYAYFEKKS